MCSGILQLGEERRKVLREHQTKDRPGVLQGERGSRELRGEGGAEIVCAGKEESKQGRNVGGKRGLRGDLPKMIEEET